MFAAGRFEHEDVSVELNDGTLIISNSKIKRVLDISAGVPRTVSLEDGEGRVFASPLTDAEDFSFIGINFPSSKYGRKFSVTSVEAKWNPPSLFDGGMVAVSIFSKEETQGVETLREHFIYPGLPVIAGRVSIKTAVMPNVLWTDRGGLKRNSNRNTATAVEQLESCVDRLQLSGVKPRFSVEFSGRTDYTNDIVVKRAIHGDRANGNLLFCEDDDCGLFILQEAPPSGERRDFEEYDFRIAGNAVLSCCWGVHPSEVRPEEWFAGYRNAIGVYHGKADGCALLKRYLKTRFPNDQEKCGAPMVNPWGCGQFSASLDESFLVREVAAAGRMGAGCYQVDDGWQHGAGLAELTGFNRAMSLDFWRFSEKLPSGFDNVSKAAKAAGVELALWLAPSSNAEYRDWFEFSELVLDINRRYGIRIFKIDAIKLRTFEAERNLERMLRRAREVSNGEISFNLDVTNGQRSGYFMFLEYGSVFLENRYAYAGLGYHPESTLRNLWSLAEYVRPQCLQIEIPFPGDIDHEFYESRHIDPPDLYPIEYWAAIAMFANPLLWLAPSMVDAVSADKYKRIMDLHARFRDEIFAGEIFPIGAMPDGKSFSGFQSHDFAKGSGIIIIFRELGSVKSRASLKLNFLSEKLRWERISGDDASVSQTSAEEIVVSMQNAPSFGLFKYREV